MALNILTIIFFIGGFLAVLYSVMALLSILKYSRAQKALPEKYETEQDKPDTVGPPVADAFCRRARILLQHQRFDAALADCKRAIDINAKHTEAHTLWEHALEKEIPPWLITESSPEILSSAVETAPAEKKVKKVVKKIKRRKKIAAKPVLEEKPIESAVPEEKPPEAAPPPEPAKKPPTQKKVKKVVEPPPVPEVEIPLDKDLELEPEIELEPVEDEPEIQLEAKVDAVPAAVLTVEPDVEETVKEENKKEEVAIPAVELTPVPEEETPLEKEPEIELEPFETEPEIQLGVEADTVPATESVTVPAAEPEAGEEDKGKITAKVAATPEPPTGDEQGPLIPEDKLVEQKPPGESLLEEFDREKLKEFEEGEAGAGDAEWTRYADKNAPELAKSKIDMNDLPEKATGLKETLIDLRQAETYNLQGESNISKNLYNNAIKDFSRALAINPNYIDALINRGSAYSQLGRFNDALIDFNHALKFENKDHELYNKRGEVYIQNNMYDQAIKDFTAAVVLNPMFSDAYLNRGRAYSEKGMPDEAMTDFNHAIEADSGHSFGFIDRAAPGLSVDDDTASNTEEADQFNKKGLADLESDKFKEAQENFTHAINLSANDAEGYINRGRALIKLNKPDEAMADFNQAVLFDPLNAALYYWRAQAWKAKEEEFNMTEDLKLSCEMGHEPACLDYRKLKPTKK